MMVGTISVEYYTLQICNSIGKKLNNFNTGVGNPSTNNMPKAESIPPVLVKNSKGTRGLDSPTRRVRSKSPMQRLMRMAKTIIPSSLSIKKTVFTPGTEPEQKNKFITAIPLGPHYGKAYVLDNPRNKVYNIRIDIPMVFFFFRDVSYYMLSDPV